MTSEKKKQDFSCCQLVSQVVSYGVLNWLLWRM